MQSRCSLHVLGTPFIMLLFLNKVENKLKFLTITIVYLRSKLLFLFQFQLCMSLSNGKGNAANLSFDQFGLVGNQFSDFGVLVCVCVWCAGSIKCNKIYIEKTIGRTRLG